MRTNPIDAIDAMAVTLWTFWQTAPVLTWLVILVALVASVYLWRTDDYEYRATRTPATRTDYPNGIDHE